VIVVRFQVPELHDGHRKLIEHIRDQHGQVLVLLGCSQVLGSKRHPLDYPTREKMLKAAYSDILVAPLADMPTDDSWSQQLDSIVQLACPIGRVVLYGGRDSFIPHYKGKYPTHEIELEYSTSGTELRRITANRIRVSADFRAGVIYAYANTYQRVFPTVDIAIIRDGKVLLGKKPNNTLWCFPGGFVDQSDERLEDAAAREAEEETGVHVYDLEYVCSHRNRDWRYRHADDGVITTVLFATTLFDGVPKAGDDLQEVSWFPVSHESIPNLVDTHKELFQELIQKYSCSKETAI
jgi:bifunctional NMN adenylyltransferase/nudix hydrolase